MWVLKLQTGEGIYRIPSSIEQPTFKVLVSALTKFGQDVKHARYIDEDGDHCILCEATFPDFLESAAQGASKTKVLKLVMTAPSESSWTMLSFQDAEDKPKHGKGKRAGRGKQNRQRGRSRSSSQGSHGSRRGRRSHRSRSCSGSSGSSSSSSGSSRSRSSSRGSDPNNGKFHGCSSCRFQEGKITFMLKESFRRNGEKTLIPGGSKAVQRAFYGDAEHAWDDSKGKDVTEAVKAILQCGQPLQAQNKLFGDPAHGVEKMLIIEAAIPPCPVSPSKADGFIKALRDEYVNDVECGVGRFFDHGIENFEPFETPVLESFEQMVRSADSCDEAISMLARSWGVKDN